jgi:hypothetical protein
MVCLMPKYAMEPFCGRVRVGEIGLSAGSQVGTCSGELGFRGLPPIARISAPGLDYSRVSRTRE